MRQILLKWSRDPNRLLLIAGAILAAITLAGILFANPPLPSLPADAVDSDAVIETLEGRVVDVLAEEAIESGAGTQYVQQVEVEITAGDREGETIITESGSWFATDAALRVKPGMRVLVGHMVGPTGERFFIADSVRRPTVYWLVAIFVVATVIVGRWTGVRSLLGLAYSVYVIARFLLPRILVGQNPVLVSIAGAVLLVVPSLYLVYGWRAKTHAAALGMLGSLLVTWCLAALFASSAHLTGFGSDEGTFLMIATDARIDLRGVVLGGIIIGTLGVLDDIAVAQSSAVLELHAANPALPMADLFGHAMAVGRDHIASMVNTLVMAYVGAALPLFLLLTVYQEPLRTALNRELFVEEIVRTLVGSLGLMLAVPLTSLIAAWMAHKRARRPPSGEHRVHGREDPAPTTTSR